MHSLLIAGLALALGAAAPAVAADVAEYRQWLGANGAQHVILDDYAPTYKATVVLSAAMSNVSANQSIFCCRSGTGGQYTYKTFSLFYRSDVGLRFDYNVTEGRFKGPTLSANARFTVVASGTNMIVNGSAKAAQAFQDFVPGEGLGHLSVFATHRGGDTQEVGAYANMTLYSMKIYDTVDGADGVLVKDLHPCVDTDGAYGLYDTVSGRIYYNDATTGSGTFSISPVVVDVNGNPVGDTSALDHPAGGAFVWDNATGSLANWTNAVNWTAKDGYPGLAAATATFGPDTPTAEASLGGASVTNGTLYVKRSDVTIENGYLLTKVNMSAASRLVVASDATLDTLSSVSSGSGGWSELPHDAEVIVKGVLTNYSANAISPVNGTNVTIRVDGGKMFGLYAPMMNTCTNFRFEVVNGGIANLGGRWVYQSNVGQVWKPANSGYAALGGSTLLHAGGYHVPLNIGEGNYLVVSNSTFGTSQNNMELSLGGNGNFADFHNATIGTEGFNRAIVFKVGLGTGRNNRLHFSGTLQMASTANQFSLLGTDGIIDFDHEGYVMVLQVGIGGTNNVFRVGKDAVVHGDRKITFSAGLTNALFEVCGVYTNKGGAGVCYDSRISVKGGVYVCPDGSSPVAVTNGGVFSVSGESPYALVRNLYLRDGGALEFSLPETPWAAAPVETTLTGGIFDGSKVRVEVGEFREKSFTDIPLVKFIPYNSGQKFTVPENLDGFLELHNCLSSGSTLRWEDNTLILRTKYHKDGLSIIVR